MGSGLRITGSDLREKARCVLRNSRKRVADRPHRL
ncbi:hypothetical protein Rrhod_4078 [Rhodococcus rhodnii LMG 5362]|uniref:Uncharacterized protein n=1 Tax=Rhodococcus rhodnii LMG 5362 TaxID=1273125 RepID=R7WHK7_9NOCA|nr:hypothetical protein Rrhod_4078 [Rhodococcus rhodnii LMG 5362]